MLADFSDEGVSPKLSVTVLDKPTGKPGESQTLVLSGPGGDVTTPVEVGRFEVAVGAGAKLGSRIGVGKGAGAGVQAEINRIYRSAHFENTGILNFILLKFPVHFFV